MTHLTRSTIKIYMMVWIPLAGAGCGGGDFGERLSVPQEKHHRLQAPLSSGQVLRVPADQPFSVLDATRQSQGPATATSTVAPTGVASCAVTTSAGGTASAEFRVGHVLRNDTAEPLRATVTFNVAFECSLRNPKPPYAVDPVQLKAFITDSHRRALGKVLLTAGDLDRLPNHWTGSSSPAFDLILEPNTAYHLVVAGRVEAGKEDGIGPDVTLGLTSVNIQVSGGAS